jgi:uncharacterized membrane protein YhaH (DUF805 family)
MFKNPFSFEGRIRRLEYGLSMIVAVVAYFIFIGIAVATQSLLVSQILGIPMLIAFFWFAWAQAAKRCHDLGRSGWFQLIPLYGFALLFMDSDEGMNEYGDHPKFPTGMHNLGNADNGTLDGHLRVN